MNSPPPTPREILEATRQVALLARLGYPLAEGLKSMGEASPWLDRVGEAMAGGDSLGRALQRHPRVFSPFYAAMVQAAEASEHPEGLLTRLSEWLERADSVRRRVRTALFYPLLVLDTLLLQLLLLVFLGVPQVLFGLLATGDTPAPAWIVEIASSGWLGLLVGLALVMVNVAALQDGPLASRATGLLPWAGPLRALAEQGLWARALGSLLAAGLDVPEALRRAGTVVRHPALQEEFRGVAERVDAGSTLAEALAEGPSLDPWLAWSAAAGQAREELGVLMLEAADALDAQVERRVEHTLRMTEPWAMLSVGVLVLLGLVAFWFPFYAGISGVAG